MMIIMAFYFSYEFINPNFFVVELQGIEPWSREDERVRSTCLVAL